MPLARSSTSHGDGEHTALGAKIYQVKCESCHGEHAQGDDRKRSPRLAGQYYDYLLLQMHEATAGQRPNFSADHVDLLRRLQPSELTAVGAYLSRLKP